MHNFTDKIKTNLGQLRDRYINIKDCINIFYDAPNPIYLIRLFQYDFLLYIYDNEWRSD